MTVLKTYLYELKMEEKLEEEEGSGRETQRNYIVWASALAHWWNWGMPAKSQCKSRVH